MILTLNTIGLSRNGSDTVCQQMFLHVAINVVLWIVEIEGRV
jgi:hypothetical protein